MARTDPLMAAAAVAGVMAVLVAAAGAMPMTPEQMTALMALRPDSTLLNLSDAEIATFLDTEPAVEEFVNCFLGLRCKSIGASNLIKQIKTLGLGGNCARCSATQQERVQMVVYDVISALMVRYPEKWRRVLPKLGNLVG